MPIYDFRCRACGADFTLVLSIRDYEGKAAACPKCQAKDLERLVTAPQVITSKKS